MNSMPLWSRICFSSKYLTSHVLQVPPSANHSHALSEPDSVAAFQNFLWPALAPGWLFQFRSHAVAPWSSQPSPSASSPASAPQLPSLTPPPSWSQASTHSQCPSCFAHRAPSLAPLVATETPLPHASSASPHFDGPSDLPTQSAPCRRSPSFPSVWLDSATSISSPSPSHAPSGSTHRAGSQASLCVSARLRVGPTPRAVLGLGGRVESLAALIGTGQPLFPGWSSARSEVRALVGLGVHRFRVICLGSFRIHPKAVAEGSHIAWWHSSSPSLWWYLRIKKVRWS